MNIVKLTDKELAALKAAATGKGRAAAKTLATAAQRLAAPIAASDCREWVAAELDARGWSQNQLAIASGVAHPIINRWLNGYRDIYATTLETLVETLGTPAS